MLNFLKSSKAHKLFSPCAGKLINLCDVNDGVFSKGILGKGCAVIPKENSIVSPMNGKITMIFETKHAISIQNEDGFDFLIHVGIDTVMLKGQGFRTCVQIGDCVKVGDKLLEIDFEFIRSKNYKDIIVLVGADAQDFKLLNTNIQVNCGDYIGSFI